MEQFNFFNKIVKDSAKQLPAMKYAVGIVGLLAILAIIGLIKVSFQVAAIGIIVLIMLMVFLLIFAKLTTSSSAVFHYPKLLLLWSSAILAILTVILIFTSAFFSYPINLNSLAEKKQTEVSSAKKSLHIEGRVIDDNTNQDLPGVKVQWVNEIQYTDSRGNFNIELKDTTNKRESKVMFSLKGYKDQYFKIRESNENLRISLIKQ